MDNSGEQPPTEDNIIRTPELSFDPEGGLGYEFFRLMNFYKNNIAQYVIEHDEADTYSELLKRCIRTAMRMKQEGITRKDIVCLCTYNHKNSCVPFIAATFLGATVASLDPSLSVMDTSHLLSQVQPSILFIVPESVDLIEKSLQSSNLDAKLVVFGESQQHQEFEDYLQAQDGEEEFEVFRADPKETAVIFFSSGTTGLPKGICQSSYALLAQGLNVLNLGVITSVSLYYSSLYWISASIFLTSCIQSGTARVVCKKFDPQEAWSIIEKYKVSFMFLAPNQALDLCKAGRPDGLDTSNLLVMYTGGGALSNKQILTLRDLLPGTFVCQAYGQTEVAGVLTCFNVNSVKDTLLLHHKPASCGKPMPGIHYKIVDAESDKILGPNKHGELRVKTAFTMNGYHKLDASESFDADGWLKTGDVAYYDQDECFYIIDRIKEMLKYKSWHIAPAMLEGILNSHPAVRRSIVIGIPHEEDGDHPMAVVILEEDVDVTENQIVEYVALRVLDRQRLRAGVKFVTSFPMTPSGKVKRQEIRRRILTGEI